MESYDLIVIGSGPAGEKAAARASYFGKTVAMVEKEPVLGGAAANTGTVPSKTLRESALFLSGFHQRQLFGIEFNLKERVTIRDFLAHERLVKENERARIMENLKRHHITLLRGMASFVDAHTISVKPDRCPEFLIHGEAILIATGSYPNRPANFPFHDQRVYDSDTIVSLHEIPQRMVVVGGGVIGCEYACIFAVLGVKLILVEKRDSLVGSLDHEIASTLKNRMEADGVVMCMNDSVVHIDAGATLSVTLQSGATIETDTILVSAGRCGNTAGLRLDNVGISVTERGHILVNEHCRTTVPNIYAAGDVVGNPALASTAMEQGRIAVSDAFQLEYQQDMANMLPFGLYTIPECSMVGETEESLTAKKIPFIVGKARYAKNARGQIIGDRHGLLKLIFREEDMKLVGVHMIGEMATELVHIGLTAMVNGANADQFIQTCYNYPTLTEMYKYAAYDALGRRALKQIGRPMPAQT
jgi:NAD(P) transhydrogenase